MHFKLENMENLNGQWVSVKFTMNFKLTLLILNWTFFSPTCEFEIDLELTQILKSTTGDQF